MGRTIIVSFADLPNEFVEEWLQHVRAFDATHPNCYIVLHARTDRTSAEIIEILQGLEPSLDTITVTPTQRED